VQFKMICATKQMALQEFYYLQRARSIYSTSLTLFRAMKNAKHGRYPNCLTKESLHDDQLTFMHLLFTIIAFGCSSKFHSGQMSKTPQVIRAFTAKLVRRFLTLYF